MLVVVALLLTVPRISEANLTPQCNGHGATNSGGLGCTCMSGYFGPDCSQRQCPHGRAWADFPTATDEAHAVDIECSGVGYCDRSKGTCECRSIFDGPACEKLKCPGEDCSGHGQCVTMKWAADHWDGRTLVRPHATYDLWDAEKVTGCLCDAGFSGYDCSRIDCPRGDIPEQDSDSTRKQQESMRLECQAESGFFSFSFRGSTSALIPYNTPYGHFERYLEDMPSVGDVVVTMSNYSDFVCGASKPVETTITFIDDLGSLPAARLSGNNLTGAPQPILRMVTKQVLRCGECESCFGGLYLRYDGELTSKLAWNATADDVQVALEALKALGTDSDFGEINVTVIGSGTICSEGNPKNTTIEFRSVYGNVYNLSMINSLRSRTTGLLANVTLSADKGTKHNKFCSDRGTCDFSTGTCQCLQLHSPPFSYRYQSSDGYGGRGTRGDCGHIAESPRSCPVAYNVFLEATLECAGHGVCDNSTFTCDCENGYYGGDCATRMCPHGPAWFAEATGNNEAREMTECSNMGTCDQVTGKCVCRDGFGGSACERMDCPTGASGSAACSGHGRCVPLWRLAELSDFSGEAAGITYGAATQQNEAQWDSRRIHACYCDTKDSRQGNAGPFTYVSGVKVANPNVGGYYGYDCSRRWCPVGDDPRTSGGELEVQKIRCSAAAGAFFRVRFRRQWSERISTNASAAMVESALEKMSTIGDVQVALSHGKSACDPSWAFNEDAGMSITFLTELGDLPMIMVDPGYNVSETVKGTKEEAECSNQGFCDHTKGECMCIEGYIGSDGDGYLGMRRDCGRLDPHGATSNMYLGVGA